MTIFERALELVPANSRLGLGSGRAAAAFVRLLGRRVQQNSMTVQAVATSAKTAALAREYGIPILEPSDAGVLDLTFDGADEVDPNLDLIKGYGRAMVREKIVAAMSRNLVILVDDSKLVGQLGQRGRLPVEVVPFAQALCHRRLMELGCRPAPAMEDGRLVTSENGNHILDCGIDPISDAAALEHAIRQIPGIVGTGLFLGMAGIVLVGRAADSTLIDERHRKP